MNWRGDGRMDPHVPLPAFEATGLSRPGLRSRRPDLSKLRSSPPRMKAKSHCSVGLLSTCYAPDAESGSISDWEAGAFPMGSHPREHGWRGTISGRLQRREEAACWGLGGCKGGRSGWSAGLNHTPKSHPPRPSERDLMWRWGFCSCTQFSRGQAAAGSPRTQRRGTGEEASPHGGRGRGGGGCPPVDGAGYSGSWGDGGPARSTLSEVVKSRPPV